ncbi:MHS family MFS transporter, partial [Streptococcus pneumoniae]|uniref:MHS family MFS transporter n=1 Tax=Streptococcus pneumoniae TaxID=1313 RepID=UPI0013DB8835
HMLALTTVAVIAMGVSTLVCGMLSDRYGRSRVIMISAAVAAVWAMFFFPLLDTRNPLIIALSMSTTLAIMGGVYG